MIYNTIYFGNHRLAGRLTMTISIRLRYGGKTILQASGKKQSIRERTTGKKELCIPAQLLYILPFDQK